MENRRLANLTAFLGNIFEHLETAAFTFTGALIFGYFFPEDTGSFWNKYGIGIAISGSFWLQPFGAMIFSWIGDTFGRNPALRLSYITAIVPTLFIILIPSYELIGAWSSILLILCRVTQGLGSGGAFGGRIVYVLESNTEKARHFNTGVLASVGFFGALLATGLSAVFMQGDGFSSQGWKAPYILAFVLGLVLLLMKRFFSETPLFLAAKNEKPTAMRSILKKYPRELTLVLLLGMASLVPFYLGLSWMGGFLKNTMGLTDSEVLVQSSKIMLLSGVLCFCSFAFVARKLTNQLMLILSISLSVLITGFLYVGLKEANLLYLQIALYLLPVYTALLVPVMFMPVVALFPAKDRYRGFSIPFAVGQALMVGTTPLFAAIIINLTGQAEMVTMLTVVSTVMLVVCYFIVKKRE